MAFHNSLSREDMTSGLIQPGKNSKARIAFVAILCMLSTKVREYIVVNWASLCMEVRRGVPAWTFERWQLFDQIYWPAKKTNTSVLVFRSFDFATSCTLHGPCIEDRAIGMNSLASLSSVRIAKHHCAKYERLRHERRACIGVYVCFTLSLVPTVPKLPRVRESRQAQSRQILLAIRERRFFAENLASVIYTIIDYQLEAHCSFLRALALQLSP